MPASGKAPSSRVDKSAAAGVAAACSPRPVGAAVSDTTAQAGNNAALLALVEKMMDEKMRSFGKCGALQEPAPTAAPRAPMAATSTPNTAAIVALEQPPSNVGEAAAMQTTPAMMMQTMMQSMMQPYVMQPMMHPMMMPFMAQAAATAGPTVTLSASQLAQVMVAMAGSAPGPVNMMMPNFFPPRM